METRRSARQAARQIIPAITKLAKDGFTSAEEGDASKRISTKTTRQKRARDEDDAKDKPLKRHTKSKSKPTHSKPTIPRTTSSGIANMGPVQPPVTASVTNYNANNEQETYWLLKAEPLPRYENGVNVAFSIDDLAACTVPEPWSGVRNYQARNNMQAMRKGDLGFFYHSNAKPSGVAGILHVVEEAKVDETAFDPKDAYYDPKSDRENPKWYCVGVEYVKKFEDVVDLAKLKGAAKDGGPLASMQLITNSRLSVCRVTKDEWKFILGLAGEGGLTDQEEKKEGSERDS